MRSASRLRLESSIAKRMFQFPAALLWVPTLANGYVSGMIVHFAWKQANGVHEAQADFELAMLVAAISFPIACIFTVGLFVWAAMRFAVRRSADSTVSIGPLAVSALNVAAPFLLWFFLRWIIR